MNAIAENPTGTESDRCIPPSRLAHSGLRPLRLGGRELLSIVQGGMGVGVSAHRLAGSVPVRQLMERLLTPAVAA